MAHVVRAAAHPTVETDFGRWAALNAPLGLEAFGVNILELEPGDGYEHDETGTGDQELYVVVAGRAAYTVDGERVELGVGDVLAVPDPASSRDVRGLEPGTRVLCIGTPRHEAVHPFGEWIPSA